MNNFSCLLMAFMAASTLLVSQQDNKLTPKGKKQEGIFLFDGNTFNGWNEVLKYTLWGIS
jgi:hypothetical protein